MTTRRGAILACTALLLAVAGPRAEAQRAEAPEASVKAAFIYKFAGYIEWPAAAFPSPDAAFVIGVLGSDEVADELAKIVPGRTLAGHPVAVRRIKEGDAIKDLHLLFVGKRETGRLATILRAAQQQGILGVTESERGLEAGSAINFVMVDDRVGFEVSLDAAERSGHRISSRMLTVARRVLPKS